MSRPPSPPLALRAIGAVMPVAVEALLWLLPAAMSPVP